ncbi:ferredoxin [Streptomyces sp. NPDC058701]|uniref:ferredoxin n=1 Tax=Streptomyces sp. NPDC058701 TaxID=3346608 RepID=UPI00366289A7
MAKAWIRLDGDRCRGTGLCAAMSERHFEMDGSGTGRVVVAEVASEEDLLDVLAIAECCPTESITVTTADAILDEDSAG